MKTQDEIINELLEQRTPNGQVLRSKLDGIWRNGYHNGYENGYETAKRLTKARYEEELHKQYNKGYNNGVDAGRELSVDALQNARESNSEAYQNGYDKGADDGRYELWRAIKKLYLNPDEGGFSTMDIFGIFGAHQTFSDILRNYTPEEVIEKVKSYEESKKSAPTNRDKFEEVFGIRPDEDRQSIVIMSGNGGPRYIDLDKPYKEPEKSDPVESDVNRFWN